MAADALDGWGTRDRGPAGGRQTRHSACLSEDQAGALGLAHLMTFHGYPLAVPTARLSPAQIWKSRDDELVALLKISPAARERMLEFRRRFDQKAAIEGLRAAGAELLALGDPDYPLWLSQIHDPPAGLFVLAAGDVPPRERLATLATRPGVAVVGARGASRYGIDAAQAIAAGLSREGVCVVSGMASGIDSAAHRGALTGRGGSIAVLGCGPDVCYPHNNVRLYRELLAGGVIVSEYPPGTEPRPWRFPARNRIIAGLAEGVVVVEAKARSGALITADFSLDAGREVWAVPGSIFSEMASGPHSLLRQGASAATSAAEILEDLGIATGEETFGRGASREPAGRGGPLAAGTGNGYQEASGNVPQDLAADEAAVLALLDAQPRLPDDIAALSGLDGARVAAALIWLELKGLARNDPVRGFTL